MIHDAVHTVENALQKSIEKMVDNVHTKISDVRVEAERLIPDISGVSQVFMHPIFGVALRIERIGNSTLWIPLPERYLDL